MHTWEIQYHRVICSRANFGTLWASLIVASVDKQFCHLAMTQRARKRLSIGLVMALALAEDHLRNVNQD